MWEKGSPFKEKNISTETESYSVIIQKTALIQTHSVGLLNQSITMCLSGYKYSSD